jgi:hypothetical protein
MAKLQGRGGEKLTTFAFLMAGPGSISSENRIKAENMKTSKKKHSLVLYHLSSIYASVVLLLLLSATVTGLWRVCINASVRSAVTQAKGRQL